MTRNELIKFIQDEVTQLAFEQLKRIHPTAKAPELNKKEAVSEEDAEHALFFGLEKGHKEQNFNRYTIKESETKKLTVKSSEIQEFEKEIKSFATENKATVTLDSQKNGRSMYFFMKNGIEALASGVLAFGDKGSLRFELSMQDGLNIHIDNLEIDDDVKRVIENLHNFYTTWSTKWRESLSGTKEEEPEMPVEPALPNANGAVQPPIG